ncbi:MAG: hypothetical protein K9J85_10365 [Desulfobacteraceae bacterium]|nr:hypothetical protein [Desulfobacteraceae bacterium]
MKRKFLLLSILVLLLLSGPTVGGQRMPLQKGAVEEHGHIKVIYSGIFLNVPKNPANLFIARDGAVIRYDGGKEIDIGRAEKDHLPIKEDPELNALDYARFVFGPSGTSAEPDRFSKMSCPELIKIRELYAAADNIAERNERGLQMYVVKNSPESHFDIEVHAVLKEEKNVLLFLGFKNFETKVAEEIISAIKAK